MKIPVTIDIDSHENDLGCHFYGFSMSHWISPQNPINFSTSRPMTMHEEEVIQVIGYVVVTMVLEVDGVANGIPNSLEM